MSTNQPDLLIHEEARIRKRKKELTIIYIPDDSSDDDDKNNTEKVIDLSKYFQLVLYN